LTVKDVVCSLVILVVVLAAKDIICSLVILAVVLSSTVKEVLAVVVGCKHVVVRVGTVGEYVLAGVLVSLGIQGVLVVVLKYAVV
jgi:hypothetical protein